MNMDMSSGRDRLASGTDRFAVFAHGLPGRDVAQCELVSKFDPCGGTERDKTLTASDPDGGSFGQIA
jgi:hypothetical protein